MHVKMNDHVEVLTGKDRGMRGNVIAIDRKRGRVKVERRNMITKHVRPNPLTGEEGTRKQVEGWLDASNVALYNEEQDETERVWNRYVGKDGEFYPSKHAARASFEGDAPQVIQKVRVGKKSGHVYDAISASES